MIADELARTPFDIVDDPEGSRQVVGLRLRSGVRQPGHALLDLHRRLRHLAGDYGVRSVDLPFPAPDRLDWEQRFSAKVRTGRPVGLLRLPAGILSAPVGYVQRSALAWRVREALSDRLGAGAEDRLGAVPEDRLGAGPEALSLVEIARWIAVHPRTLQRALADEGLSFAEILDCVRREQARTLLTGTDVPIAAISARLGFAEPPVLTRCARRWWGRTPSQVRSARSTARRPPPSCSP